MTSLVRKSKRMYFQQSIDNNKGDPKGIWKALKSLTKSQKSTKITELRREDGTLETDTSAMANMLNEYFVNIAQELKQIQLHPFPLTLQSLRSSFPRPSIILSLSSIFLS